ncbi:hypothetical protein [Neobacillus sp. SAB-20_R2A]|uniref:hypothetical protein n=1 Tax=Neobacillus sp. SAB-20_R2A TaxID=3120519 RepID=UPI003C6E230B
MKTRVGIVGPLDSVSLISSVAEEFSDRIITKPYIYKKLEETEEIVKRAKDDVDVWLFSGQAPYAVAQNTLENLIGFYPHLNGSSLSKVLLDIGYKDHKKLDRLSIDTIPSEQIYETFSEMELKSENLKLNPYNGYKRTDELIDFHYQLYKSGQVDNCITCIRSVYETLKAMNVPAYRVKPTKMAIRGGILKASQKGEIIQFKSSQISVLILHIFEMDKLIGENCASYESHRLILKLQDVIIDFAEKILGSFINQGNGKYFIFSTRGALEKNIQKEIPIFLEKITVISPLYAHIGIGYGKTVFGAEQNAYLALNYAKQYQKNTIMLAVENGVIEGPLQSEKSFTFSYRSDDTIFINRLKLAGVNISTYNKILSIQDNHEHRSISAFELAKWLDMTQRNARRILSDLEKNKLAKIVGEEAPVQRGRPRNIYRVGYIEEDMPSLGN